MQIKVNINIGGFKANRIVRYFVLSDLFFAGGWGLITPIFAVFLTDRIPGVTLFTVGAVTGVFGITRAIIQMPVAMFLDKHEGEKDDFYTLILALTLAGFSAMAFLLAKSVLAIYVISFLHGISSGLYSPSWSAIFSRHLDKNKYAFDWSLDSTTIGLATGLAAFVGGWAAKVLGFETVFLAGAILSFTSAFLLLIVPDLVMPKATIRMPFMKEHIIAQENLVEVTSESIINDLNSKSGAIK